MKVHPNCQRCKDRTTCRTPCVTLRNYLKKNFPRFGKRLQTGMELNVGIPEYQNNPWPEPAGQKRKISERELVARTRDIMLLTFLEFGYPRKLVGKVLGIKGEDIRWKVYDARRRFKLN